MSTTIKKLTGLILATAAAGLFASINIATAANCDNELQGMGHGLGATEQTQAARNNAGGEEPNISGWSGRYLDFH